MSCYDGTAYSLEAYSDNRFRFSTDSKIKGIVDGLKSHSWPQQEPAVRSVNDIDFKTASGNVFYVLRLNIFKVADAFIDRRNNVTQLDKKKRFTVRDGMTRYSKR